MREPMPCRRYIWRQKVRVIDADTGAEHTFYIDFGEYKDGRLGEIFITTKRMGTFARGVLDTLARSVSLSLQSGTPLYDIAEQLIGQDYPPQGTVVADGSSVTRCSSITDYIGQEMLASYAEDGRRRTEAPSTPAVPSCEDLPLQAEKVAGYIPEKWRTGV